MMAAAEDPAFDMDMSPLPIGTVGDGRPGLCQTAATFTASNKLRVQPPLLQYRRPCHDLPTCG